jgi:eukaryotic-like serine/threonine-protein kinase
MPFEPGQKIGDYEVVAQLGAGGLGAVYEVRHLISQRCEAMKILLPDQSGTPEMVERFHREVQTLATLSHTNIAALHTAFYYENQLAMIMELVPGETLRDRFVKGLVSQQQALGYIGQVLQALIYAHNLGVVHRDIKPSNVMITENGGVKLLDFGIAQTGHGTGLTRAGYLLGSLNYMSPEQVNGGKATQRSDLYSVGVTLYELVTGKLPITGATTYQIMMNHMSQIPAAPHEIAPHVSATLSAAIMRALEKDPAHRFASAEEFLLQLQQASGVAHRDTAMTMPLQSPSHGAPAAAPSASAMFETKPAATSWQPQPMAVQPQSHSVSTSAEHKPSSGSGIESLPLQEISRKLAVYIGPVAKFVIKKLAAQYSDLDTIYREAAKQIPSDADRIAFLRAKNQ